MEQIEKIKKYLAIIEKSIAFIRNELDIIESNSSDESSNKSNLLHDKTSRTEKNNSNNENNHCDTPNTKTKDNNTETQDNNTGTHNNNQNKEQEDKISKILNNEYGPEAVNFQAHIKKHINKEQTLQKLKAKSIVDYYFQNKNLNGFNFIEIDCYNSFLIKELAIRDCSHAIGLACNFIPDRFHYIINSMEYQTIITHNDAEIPELFFDYCFIVDKLDHTKNPEILIKYAHRFLQPKGTLLVRCHPVYSPHSFHPKEEKVNKSHLHLVLNNRELKELLGNQYVNINMNMIPHSPMKYYRTLFKENGFKVVKETVHKTKLNEFMTRKETIKLIKENLKIENDNVLSDILEYMKITFIDYILKKK